MDAVRKGLANVRLEALNGFATAEAQLRTRMERAGASQAAPPPSELQAHITECFKQAGLGELRPQVRTFVCARSPTTLTITAIIRERTGEGLEDRRGMCTLRAQLSYAGQRG